LIGGTIQPDLYHGRALPVELIASLQAYVDTHTNYRLQFAEQPAQAQRRTLDQPIKLYFNALQNDTILHLATGAFSDPMVGFDSLMNYINMPDCPEPAIVTRALMRNDPTNQGMSLDDSNKLILAAMKTIHKWRRDLNAKDSDNDRTMNTATCQLTQSLELVPQHPNIYYGNTTAVNPTTVTPLRNLVTRLQA
jgi:hypothetical protein